MVVSIDFFGMQRSLIRLDSIEVPVQEQTRVTDILAYVKKQYPDLPLDEDMIMATVNQEAVSLDRVLKPNDSVSFLPHIGGG